MRYSDERVNEVLSWLKDEAKHLATWQQRRLGGGFGERAHLRECSIEDYMYRYTVVISLRVMLVAGSFYFYFSSLFPMGEMGKYQACRGGQVALWQEERFLGDVRDKKLDEEFQH
jgi:hypothetical protein